MNDLRKLSKASKEYFLQLFHDPFYKQIDILTIKKPTLEKCWLCNVLYLIY